MSRSRLGRLAQARGAVDGRTARPPVPLILGHWLSRVLHRLPWPVGEDLLALVGAVQGIVRPRRLQQALQWASAQPAGARGRWRLALGLLAYHGRFFAQETLVGVRHLEALRHRVTLVGETHLAQALERGGVLILGFHVGPPGSARLLRLMGYPVARPEEVAALDGGPPAEIGADGPAPGAAPPIDEESPGGRALVLAQSRRYLAAGGLVYITADGPAGAEAFRLAVPGPPIVVRSGWLALRRHTGIATLPLLAHQHGRRRVLTVYPALPPPARDPGDDRRICRDILSPLLGEYLERFPEQCRSTLWSR